MKKTLLLSAAATFSLASLAHPQAATFKKFIHAGLSPDGSHVAWIGPTAAGVGAGSVVLENLADKSSNTVNLPGADNASAEELRWSRDSKWIAVRATSSGVPAIYLVDNSGSARLVAKIPGAVQAQSFSPDGSRIAILYSTPDEHANSPTDVAPRDTGVIDTNVDRQHLAIIDVANGALKILSPRDLYVYEFDWAPSGNSFVVSAANGSGNNNWWVARLYSIDAKSGALKELARPVHQIAQPTFSPDGKTIAYIGGLMSDQGQTGGDIYLLPAAGAGGSPKNLTPGVRISFTTISWPQAGSIDAVAWAQGESQIASVDTKSGSVTPRLTVEQYLTLGTFTDIPTISVSADGKSAAFVREAPGTPPEIWAGSIGSPQQITRANAGLRPSWGKTINVHWKNEGFDVQGYLLYPENFQPGKKYPLIVHVHGGPSSAIRPMWLQTNFGYEQFAALSRAGYFVLMPNPRGSYGQGEAFTRANVKDFGRGDLRDILAGVNMVVKKYPVDGNRLGIKGWSYGGFMTMWAVTQTHRFKAAVAGAGISNWLSYTGENGISEWMVPFFGATAYENKEVFARSSAINYIANAKTPTLILVGERDSECPAPQSYEFWRGLQHVGVPTQLIVYPDEGHAFVDPGHQKDMQRRTVEWFDKYLK